MTFESFFARLVAFDSLTFLLVLQLLVSLASVNNAAAFVKMAPFGFVRAAASFNQQNWAAARPPATFTTRHQSTSSNNGNNGRWNGEVASNPGTGGRIQGCSIQLVEGSKTEWIIKIDGVQADLGRFSDVIFKKITNDAKREQRFQGFRPGTIPPHLEPTYRAFTMDECARETVLEAMQQNNIRPFENARLEMKLEQFETPPPPPVRRQQRSKKKKTSNKKKGGAVNDTNGDAPEESGVAAETVVVAAAAGDESSPSAWIAYESMKEAIDAGWKPGQSFSFVAVNVKGQQVKDASVTEGSRPLGGLSWNK